MQGNQMAGNHNNDIKDHSWSLADLATQALFHKLDQKTAAVVPIVINIIPASRHHMDQANFKSLAYKLFSDKMQMAHDTFSFH